MLDEQLSTLEKLRYTLSPNDESGAEELRVLGSIEKQLKETFGLVELGNNEGVKAWLAWKEKWVRDINQKLLYAPMTDNERGIAMTVRDIMMEEIKLFADAPRKVEDLTRRIQEESDRRTAYPQHPARA